MRNCNVTASLKLLYQAVEDGDWENNLTSCLSRQLRLERRFLVAVIEEQDLKCLVEATKWLLRKDPARTEWLEPLLKRLIGLVEPSASLHIILGLIYHFTGYDDEAIEQFKLAKGLTTDIRPTKLLVLAECDPDAQLAYAREWEEEEPGGLASEIVREISHAGKLVSSDVLNQISRSMDFDMIEELETLVRQCR